MLEKPDLEVSKKGLLKLFYRFNKGKITMEGAFEKAVAECEAQGYFCRFQSYESFRKNVLGRNKLTKKSNIKSLVMS